MDNQPNGMVALGASGLKVNPIGLGTNSWGKGRQADPGQQETFTTALNQGINLIDTAEVYHFGGSERTIGLFLADARQRVVITTKFFPFPWRLKRSALLAALHASLARLQVAQVDLYLVHFGIPPVPVETWMEAMAEAVNSGLTRAVGVSNYSPDQMRRAQDVLARHGIPLACNQVEYSLLKRNAERSGLLEMCQKSGVTLVAYRPVASGLLTGRYSPENPPKGLRGYPVDRQYLARIQPLIALLQQLGVKHGGKTPSQVALNWLICKGAVPIPGAKNVHHLKENAGAGGWRLADDEIAALDAAAVT